MAVFQTYSFLDTSLSIIGPGVSASIGGSGTGDSEEGFSIEYAEDKDTMTIGADGSGMHSLHAGQSGMIVVRLLKTSTVNQILQYAYDFQRLSSSNWGQNTMVWRNSVVGDYGSGIGASFRKFPNLNYAKEGGTQEWGFNVVQLDVILGGGLPGIAVAPALA